MSARLVGHEANRTLGRSRYEPCAKDRLACRIDHLDALLAVISARESTEPHEGFGNCNREIQYAVLDLASSLASEINELNAQILEAELPPGVGAASSVAATAKGGAA